MKTQEVLGIIRKIEKENLDKKLDKLIDIIIALTFTPNEKTQLILYKEDENFISFDTPNKAIMIEKSKVCNFSIDNYINRIIKRLVEIDCKVEILCLSNLDNPRNIKVYDIKEEKNKLIQLITDKINKALSKPLNL